MPLIVGWVLQLLILATGIFFFLRMVRTTRGSRIVRGLVVAMVGGVLGLWALSEVLELEELQFIIKSVTGFVVVIFAILFQPELRRGIAQLGAGGLFDRLLDSVRADTLRTIAQATCAMASRRTGALIAVERENPLDAYVEGGVRVDADVSKLLIETIFHPGSTLHDGAVVVRDDRIAAAACLFPLTENLEIARSTGTRHRAALGLSDETDAVTVVVSEETGEISICKRGERRENIPHAQLEEALREAVGPEAKGEADASPAAPSEALSRFVRRDLIWVVASVVLSLGLLVLARQALTTTKTVPLTVVAQSADNRTTPGADQLVIVLPSDSYRLERVPPLSVVVSATRGQLANLGGSVALSGVVELLDGPVPETLRVATADVRWSPATPGMRYAWEAGTTPVLSISSFASSSFDLTPEDLRIVADGLEGRYEARLDEAELEPTQLRITGPSGALASLRSGEIELRLEDVVIPPQQADDFVASAGLSSDLLDMGFRIDGGPVRVTIPIAPAERYLGEFERDVTLICSDAAREEERDQWMIPPGSARVTYRVRASGLIPAADPDSPAVVESRNTLEQYVEENLRVFVDLADIPQGSDVQTVRVRWYLDRELADVLGEESRDGALTFELDGEQEIRLNRVADETP